MKIRVVATILWFLSGWVSIGFFAALVGLPPAVGTVGGLAIAMVVWFDPAGWIWQRGATSARRVRPADEVAAELDERAAGSTLAAGEQTQI